MSTLNLEDLRLFRVPLPPPDVQQHCLDVAGDGEIAANRVTQGRNHALRRSQGLRRSVLTAAFNGEL